LNNAFRSGVPTGEADITFGRAKPSSIVFRFSYALKRVSKTLVGPHRILKFCLTASWLLRRFAYELSCEVYGSPFQLAALALTTEELQKWIPDGGSVIDIGCGTGRWTRLAANYAQRVVGIDYDQTYIEKARSMSNSSAIEYLVGDVTTDLRDRTFDVGLLIHVVEHIEDPDHLLRSLHNVVNTLIVEVPDFEADCLNLVRLELGSPYYSDGDHVREYTLPILKEQLNRNGWTPCYSKHHGGAILVMAKSAEPLAH
jgi:SAM-dependent methyltransferase